MTVKLNKLFSEKIALNIKTLSYIPNPKTDIDSWTASLAELELGEAAKQIFITLLELRGLDSNDLLRFQIIQQIEPNLAHLLLSLEQHYLSNSLLDTKRDQQIAELVLEIKSHHALLYVEIFDRIQQALEEDKFGFFEFSLKKKLNLLRKQVAISALNQLTELLYSLQLLYMNVPKNFWSYTYKVYQTAVSYNLHHDKIERKNTNKINLIDSIEKSFAQLVLLNILNSNKLRQSEIKELMICVEFWTALISFEKQPNSHTNYMINYENDYGPRLYSNDREENQLYEYIDVLELNTYIKSTLSNKAHYLSKVEEKNLTHVLKHHIISILSLNPDRISPRYIDEGSLEVALGITASHFFLSHAKHFRESLELDLDFIIQNNQYTLSNITNDKEIQLSSKNHEQRFNEESTRLYQVNIVNRSHSGYGLQWHNRLIKNLRTGEFILLRENPNSPWVGAIIRWMRNSSVHLIDFGVEIIAQNMCPMAVSIPKVNHTNPIYHPAILFNDEQRNYYIILPSAQVFYENQNLVLRFGQTELKIFLKNSTVLTQSCATFHFDLLEKSKQTILDEYVQQHLVTLKTQDLWESLK